MRLPYLQVDENFRLHASRTLGLALGVSRAEALCLAVDLWAAVLADLDTDADDSHAATVAAASYTGGHDVAAREIAAACMWLGDATQLVDAMSHPRVRVLERTADGFRVRGLDRYTDALEKTTHRKAWDAARKTLLGKAGWTQTPAKAWKSPAGDVFTDPAKALEAWKADRARHDVRFREPKPHSPETAAHAPVEAPNPPTTAASVLAENIALFPDPEPPEAPKPPRKRSTKPKPAGQTDANTEAPPPSAYAATCAALCSVWEGLRGVKYEFDARLDGKALNWIVWGSDKPTPAQKQGAPVRSPEEAARVFRVALTWPKSFPSCGGIRDLRNHWNTYAAGPTAAPSGFPGQQPDVRRGSVRAESQQHAPGTREVTL